MVVEGECLLVVVIGRPGSRGTGLVGLLNEVPAAAEHEFGPPAVQCESHAPLSMLEEDGLARPLVDVGELGMPIGELRSGQVEVTWKALVSSAYAPATRPTAFFEL